MRRGAGAWLGAAAVTLAVLAPLAGAGGAGPAGVGPGGVGVAELAEELAGGGAYLEPLELAERIRSRRPLRLVDVRDSSEFIRLSVPTATHVEWSDLPTLEPEDGPVVLYDDGSGAAVRGWLLLRRLGHPDVRVLRGGVLGWIDDVLNPVLPAETPEEREAFDRAADLSRYFGGVPRRGRRETSPAADSARTREAIRMLSRRGCY